MQLANSPFELDALTGHGSTNEYFQQVVKKEDKKTAGIGGMEKQTRERAVSLQDQNRKSPTTSRIRLSLIAFRFGTAQTRSAFPSMQQLQPTRSPSRQCDHEAGTKPFSLPDSGCSTLKTSCRITMPRSGFKVPRKLWRDWMG
jgi:hypothetical protein